MALKRLTCNKCGLDHQANAKKCTKVDCTGTLEPKPEHKKWWDERQKTKKPATQKTRATKKREAAGIPPYQQMANLHKEVQQLRNTHKRLSKEQFLEVVETVLSEEV